MNKPAKPLVADLSQLALAALGACLGPKAAQPLPGWSSEMLAESVTALRARPALHDAGLVALADALSLSDAELMTLALIAATEADAASARGVAHAQAPLGGARPLLGLVARAFAALGATVLGLASGNAVRSGVLMLGDEPAALPERSLTVSLPILAACRGLGSELAGARLIAPAGIALPQRIAAAAGHWAESLRAGHHPGLAIRSASITEATAIAALIAQRLDRALARIEGVPPPALGPWLIATGSIPLFAPELGAGTQWRCPDLRHYDGPWLAVVPPEGTVAGTVEAECPPGEWWVPVPTAAERQLLWSNAGLGVKAAERAAASFRQGAGRIAEVSAKARGLARTRGANQIEWADVTEAVAGGCSALDARARISPAEVAEDALILPARLQSAMHDLVARARVRDRLQVGLGPAITARYRPGVRALFVGESGTGKTLAAHWFSCRLGLPLYRVDLAALTSKWIGETEKNLSEVLGAAEHADAVLFFDEADALFGARTDIGDANDRHANAQTNYLLQRIEEFDGIAILAANSRSRFDPAFVRRLDAILDFPMPEGPARAALWRAHLGQRHRLAAPEIDRLAIAVDLAGGHIRNVVLSAAARASAGDGKIGFAEIAAAVAEEYAKLGRPPPHLSP